MAPSFHYIFPGLYRPGHSSSPDRELPDYRDTLANQYVMEPNSLLPTIDQRTGAMECFLNASRLWDGPGLGRKTGLFFPRTHPPPSPPSKSNVPFPLLYSCSIAVKCQLNWHGAQSVTIVLLRERPILMKSLCLKAWQSDHSDQNTSETSERSSSDEDYSWVHWAGRNCTPDSHIIIHVITPIRAQF